jgi:hypothetical protein
LRLFGGVTSQDLYAVRDCPHERILVDQISAVKRENTGLSDQTTMQKNTKEQKE